jgi:hypothetical protein
VVGRVRVEYGTWSIDRYGVGLSVVGLGKVGVGFV